MPSVTLTPSSSTGDGYISSKSTTTYPPAANGTGILTVVTANDLVAWGQYDYADYVVYEAFYKFDTSVLPAGCQVISATFSVYITNINTGSGGSHFIGNLYNSSWSKPLGTGNWLTPATLSGLSVIGTLDSSTAIDDARNSFTGDLSQYINLSGDTDFVVASDRHVSETAPTGFELVSSLATDYGYDKPNLVIEYVFPSAFLGCNF